MSEGFIVTVAGPGLEMKREVDRVAALKLIESLLGGSRAGTLAVEGPSQRSTPAAALPQRPSITMGEFLSAAGAGSNAEKIAAIAHYYRNHLGREGLPKDEILRAFQTAGEAPPKNLSRDLQRAVSKRLVAADTVRDDLYYITNTGLAKLSPPAGPDGTPEVVQNGSTPAVTTRDQPTGAPPKSAQEERPARRQRRPATAQGMGPLDRLRQLAREGWFNSPRTSKEIVAELARRGATYKRTDLTRQLQSLTRGEELYRRKAVPEGEDRAVWVYSAQQEDLFARV